MKRSRILAACASVACGILILVMAVFFFIPAKDLENAFVRGMEQQGYTLRAGRFGKVFPFGIKARNLEIGDSRGSLVKLDEVTARVNILPLFVGRVVVGYKAMIGKGTIEGNYSPWRNAVFSGRMDNVLLEDIPFFRTVAGAGIKGSMSSMAEIRKGKDGFHGEVRISVREAVLNGLKIGEMPLPDGAFDTIRGIYRLNGDKGTLESLSMQGPGIHARLKGEIPVTPRADCASVNLTLELMPKPDYLENRKPVFLLLTRYLAAPGYYRIPIRGTLAKPVIQLPD